MSSIVPSPIGPATATRRGTMSAAHFTKLDELMSAAALEARFSAIETDVGTLQTDVDTAEAAITTLQASSHAAVTLDGASSSWLTLVGQALKLTLVVASGATAGLVDGAAATWNGAKTFASAIIASAGIQLGSLWNTNGTQSTDVGVKVGVSTADGAVHTNAKLISVGTGIGGTYTERFFITKFGNAAFPYGAAIYWGGAVSAGPFIYGPSVGQLELGVSNTTVFTLTAAEAKFTQYLTRVGSTFGIYANGTSGISETVRAISSRGDSGLKCVVVGTEQASPNASAVLFQVAKGVAVTNHTDVGNGTAVGLQVMGDGTARATDTVQLNTNGSARPTADASTRGKLWYSKSAGGAADTLQICLKSAGDTYSWVTIATG